MDLLITNQSLYQLSQGGMFLKLLKFLCPFRLNQVLTKYMVSHKDYSLSCPARGLVYSGVFWSLLESFCIP